MTWAPLLAATALFIASTPPAGLPLVDPAVKPVTECPVTLVSFRDEQEGLLVTQCDEVLRTHDGGQSWQEDAALRELWLAGSPRVNEGSPASASGGLSVVRRLVWLTPRKAIALGAGTPLAFHTEDGGKSWQRTALPVEHSVTALDAVGERVWICGKEGHLLRSDDAGRSWRKLPRAPLPPAEGFGNNEDSCSALAFIDARDGWLAQRSGKLWRTRDAGETWEPMPGPDTPPLQPEEGWGWRRFHTSLQRLSAQLAWAWTSGGLYRTRDGGKTWQRRPVSRTRALAPVPVRVEGRLPWTVWAVPGQKGSPEQLEPTMRADVYPWGEHGVVNEDMVFYRDGKRVRAGPPLTRSVGPRVPLDGFLRGNTRSWEWGKAHRNAATPASLDRQLAGDTRSWGWIGAQVLTTHDGESWFTVGALPAPVQRLAVRDADILLAGTTAGTLYRSDDLGSTWTATVSPLDAGDFARATGAAPPAEPLPECVGSAPVALLRVEIQGRGHHGGGWASHLALRIEKGTAHLEVQDGGMPPTRAEAVINRAQKKRLVDALLAAARRRGYRYDCGIGSEASATLSWSCGPKAGERAPLKHVTQHCGSAGGLLYRPKKDSLWFSGEVDPSEEGIPQAARRMALELLRPE